MIKSKTPINEAEAIIEPFWDPMHSGLKKWNIRMPGSDAGNVVKRNAESVVQDHYDYANFYRVDFPSGNRLAVWQYWAMVNFSWDHYSGDAAVLVMQRDFSIELGNYDTLLFSLASPEGSKVIISAETEKGILKKTEPAFPSCRKEVELDLQGASTLISVTIEIYPTSPEASSGWFNWIGLRYSELLPDYLENWDISDTTWDGYLKESAELSFKPEHGLYLSKEEADQLQKEYLISSAKHELGPVMDLVKAGEALQDAVPEVLGGEWVNFWTDRRFNRERDENRVLIGPGPELALAGIIKQDEKLLRLAARYALSLVSCGNWKDSFICNFPGSAWEHKAFVLSLCLYDVAVILDMAAELFTPAGINLILRKMADESGFMLFNVWNYGRPDEDIFAMNQLAWFSPGRLASLAVMEQYWPRVREYTDIAYRDLVESLERTILEDGGYPEGPNYFSVVAKAAGQALQIYARSRKLELSDVIPECVLATDTFCRVFRSTASDCDMIPISDSRPVLEENVLSSMALLMPGSSWAEAFSKNISQNRGVVDSLNGWRFLQKRNGVSNSVDYTNDSFLSLPDMGTFSSVRMLNEQPLKIIIPGGREGIGHNHDDKGSFAVEFAGEIFAADAGIGPYDEALSGSMKQCFYHNMLLPVGSEAVSYPDNPLHADILPQAEKLPDGFKVSIDCTESWTNAYTKWQRSWLSEHPDRLVITDEYAVTDGKGVAFLWITPLPITIDEENITISGKRGICNLTIPKECSCRVEALKMPAGITYNRIVIESLEPAGTLTIQADFTLQ
jgi:hypothetical protein